MKIIRRYIRAEILRHAALGLLLFTFVLFMQNLGKALEASVHTGPAAFAQLVILVLPAALVFTLPIALVVGVLIGLGRLGVDNELVALRTAGVSGRRLLAPLLQIAAATLALALLLTLWLAPLALRRLDRLTAALAGSEAAATVQPRVFFEPEKDPNWVLYVGGDAPGGGWKQVLAANMAHPDAPELTLAERGRLLTRRGADGSTLLQLHLIQGAQYKAAPDNPATSLVSSFQSIDIPFLVPSRAPTAVPLAAEPLSTLWRQAAAQPSARIEFHRRFALAFACLALALLAIPLGLRGGRGGKSGGFVLALVLVFAYYMMLVLGLGLARQGRVPLVLGVWAANLLCVAGGLWALSRLDRVPRRPVAGADPVAWFRAWLARRIPAPALAARPLHRRSWMPRLLEGYIVREFLGYTGLVFAAFLLIVLVFTAFELIGSILQNHIAPALVLEYLAYFSPQTFYLLAPVAILVGVLVTFGLMSRANEITALKACGVSAYRLLLPVLLAALVLSGLQFALDATWLPGLNQRQDALRAQIKGQPVQTFRNPGHKWVVGQNHDIFYFTFFDPGRAAFADVTVFQFDPQRFQLSRRIFAREARWDAAIPGWVFTHGWERAFPSDAPSLYQPFQVASFPQLTESPAYFATDARQGSQMGYGELRTYIATLQASGYDVARLSIALAKKIAYPLITVIMALLAFPFALSVGRRGTVAGIAVAIVVGITYWSSSSLLEALGNLNQLPASVAAWTPDVLFLGAGVYLLLRVPT